MTFFHALVLGIVEGITEFLPVSSTFHLIFASKFLGLTETDFTKFFEVFIQAAAILPVLILFGKEWLKDMELLKKVMVSFIPTAIIGFLLHKVIKDVLFDAHLFSIVVFIVVGILFFVIEALVRKNKLKLNKNISDLTFTHAAFIGVMQALAIVPGVSRAGAVIVAMMLLGVKRDQAAKYSFTLAVPTILAAAALDVIKTRSVIMSSLSSNLLLIIIGSVTAFVSSLIITKWFINYLRKNSLGVFGIYRVIFGGLLLFLGFGK
jgi:undecaprenyl-diphosphatase